MIDLDLGGARVAQYVEQVERQPRDGEYDRNEDEQQVELEATTPLGAPRLRRLRHLAALVGCLGGWFASRRRRLLATTVGARHHGRTQLGQGHLAIFRHEVDRVSMIRLEMQIVFV